MKRQQMKKFGVLVGVVLVGLLAWWGVRATTREIPLKTTVGRGNQLSKSLVRRLKAGQRAVPSVVSLTNKTATAVAKVVPTKDPGGEIVATRVSLLPPRRKGDRAGELREWIIQPRTGVTSHLEEHYRPNKVGQLELAETREYAANQVLLTLEASVDVAALRAALKLRKITVSEPLMPLQKGGCIVSVSCDAKKFETVADLMSQIHRVNPRLRPEIDPIVSACRLPNDAYMGSLWGMKRIQAPEAWDISTCATNVRVAVVDTGVNYYHEDLTDNILRHPDELPFPWVFGRNFVGGIAANEPMDDNGHGSHCAGTVVARGDNEVGVAGVAWQAQLVPVKILNYEGKGAVSAQISAYNWARQNGCHILSCSFGGGPGLTAGYTAIRQLQIMDVMLACAAGNGGDDGIGDDNDKMPQYPSSYDLDNIVAVASTGPSDELSEFSNFGLTSVDIAAPGEDILSTCPAYLTLDGLKQLWSTLDQDTSYLAIQGTSMATPHVAGAMALLKGYYPDDVYWQIIQRLTLNGDDVDALHDYLATGKRLNVYKAMLSLIPPAPIVTATPGTYEDRIEVSWKPVKGATYYKLWRRWSEGGVMTELTDWTTDLSYIDRAAEPKVGWHYYVRCSKHADGHDASPVSPAGVGYKLSPILDEWDPNDDTALGATVLTPTDAEQTHGVHSLSQWDAEDWYRVTVSANQTYVFESTGAYDMVAELYKAASTNQADLLVTDDDSGTNGNFKVIWTPTEDETVFLRVRAFDNSRAAWYTLRYSIPGFTDEWDPADDVASTATVLTPAFEEQTHGLHALSGTDTEDFFAIEMEAGKSYVFATTGDTDTFGELYCGATDTGSLVAWNDDGMDARTGNDLNFRLVYKATTTGTHYLRVKLAPSGGSAGTYTLVYSLAADSYDLVFTEDDVVDYVKEWKVNGFFASSEEATRGTNVFLIGQQVYLKWALNETNFVAVAENITNLVELLNSEGRRAAWGHAVVLNGLSADEFYDFATELPLLPAGAYVVRLTLNRDINGNPSVPELATKDNTRVCAFNVVASAADVVALEISGNAEIAAKESVQYRCAATYGDDSVVDVAPAWSITQGEDLATVQADGTVSIGNVVSNTTIVLRAVFGGQVATKEITVTPQAGPVSTAFPDVVTYPNDPMTVNVTVMIDGMPAEAGDEVAAYCGADVRGVAKLGAGGTAALSVSIAEPGEPITFKVWDASAGDEGVILSCSETIAGMSGRDYGALTLTCTSEDPFGDPAAGGDWTTGWTPARICASVFVNDAPASAGDMVAVYVDGKLVGKQGVVVEAAFGGAPAVARCDLTVNLKEESELSFLVWSKANRKYYSSATKATLAVGATLGTTDERFRIEATDQTHLQIVLPSAGWHLVSFNVLPLDPRPSVIFANPNIDMVRFDDGTDWRPGNSDDAIRLEIGKGYWVHTNSACKWTVTGTANPDLKIQLVEGWNLIGYTLEREGRVEDVLRDALKRGDITEIMSGDASYPTGNLATMQPGQAYWVCVSKSGEVSFHRVGMITASPTKRDYGPFDGSKIVRDPVRPVRYQGALVKIGSAVAGYGDCVGIYDAGNALRAVARVENTKGRITFPVYAEPGTVLKASVWNVASEDRKRVYSAKGSFTTPAAGALVTNLVLQVALDAGTGGSTPAATNAVGVVTNAVPAAQFTVTFDLGTHATRTGGGELTQQVAFGQAAVAPTLTCEAGWAFSHWDQPLTNVRAARTIHAAYRDLSVEPPPPGTQPSGGGESSGGDSASPKREVDLTFDANGGEGTMEDVTFNYDGSNTKLVPNTFTRAGHTFLGWSTTKDGRAAIKDVSTAAGVAQVVGLSTNAEPTKLYAVWGKNGFSLGTGTLVANGGTRVTVPIKIDTGRPLACASVRLAYDPNILVYVKTEKGEVAEVFDDDFIVTRPSEGVVSVSCFAASNVVAGAGTLATVSFDVRPGTEGQFSDVTIADVQLADETSVKDVTNDDPVTTENGMVRVMAPVDSVARLENAQTVAGETTLATLDVMAGDGVEATPNRLPVFVTGGVTTSNATPVAVTPPHGGWQGGSYQLLKTPTTGLRFALANVPDRVAYVVTEDRADGLSTYQVDFSTPGAYELKDENGMTSKMKFKREFLLSLALENPSPTVVNAALQQRGRNGLKRWQNYVLGLDSEDAAAKIVLKAPRTAERTKIRLSAPNVVLEKEAGVQTLFRLQKSTDGGQTWVDVGDPIPTPNFDLDVTADPTGLYRVKTEFSTPQ